MIHVSGRHLNAKQNYNLNLKHKVDKTPGEILAIVDELRFGIEINDLLYISNVINFAEQCHYVLS